METTINGRTYTITAITTPGSHPLVEADMVARGWDGITYMATGKRGAVKLAYRSAKTGRFSLSL